MRILWLSAFLPYPPQGGALQRGYNLFAHVARRHDVTLVALNQPRILGTPAQVAEAVSALGALGAEVAWFSMPSESSRARRMWVVASAGASRDPYAVRWMASRAMRVDVGARLLERPPDLVHVDTLGLAPYVERSRRVPIVLNHHNVESHMTRRRAVHERNPLGRSYLRRDAAKLERMERRWASGAATNLVVSELDGERLRRLVPGARTDVVENGVDLAFFRPEVPLAQQRGLVFAGRWSWYPNRQAADHFLTSIWPRLVADDPSRTMTFVGREPYPGLVEASERDPRIAVTGFVDDVRPYLDRAAIYVCPIVDGGGTRLKILDALAMAKPLVATRMAVEGLSMEDGRHFLRAETPTEYVQQIGRLEADASLRKRLALEGRAHVEARFGWDRIGTHLEAAYEEILRAGVVAPET